jgi:hypothetical protein
MNPELQWAGNVAQISETNTVCKISSIRKRICDDTNQTKLTAVWEVASCDLVSIESVVSMLKARRPYLCT